YIIIMTLILAACTPKRKPAQADSDLQRLVEDFHAKVQKPMASFAECREQLPQHYQLLYGLDWNEVNLQDYTARELERLIGLSFEIRLAMKRQMNSIGKAEGEGYECFKEARNVFRGLRYLEDYLVEHLEHRENTKIEADHY